MIRKPSPATMKINQKMKVRAMKKSLMWERRTWSSTSKTFSSLSLARREKHKTQIRNRSSDMRIRTIYWETRTKMILPHQA